MFIKRFIAFTSLLFLVLPMYVFSQKIRLYNSEQGLPNSLINNVFQDERGYIWIATNNGISYFDGIRFTTFQSDPTQQENIASDLVKTIFTDSKGTTWIGSSNGLQTFNYENNAFQYFDLQYKDYANSRYISSVIESPDHQKILISIAGLGIIVYNLATYKIDIETTEKIKKIYNTSFLGNLFFDAEGYLWTFAEQGDIYRLDFNKIKNEKIVWSEALSNTSKEIVISAMTEDKASGNLLIGTYYHGLFIFDRSLGLIRKAKGNSSDKYQIRALLSEANNANETDANIWIGTENEGLKKLNWKDENIVDATLPNSPINIKHCKVHSLTQDTQGNIWVGIFQKGLLIIPKSTYGFEYLKIADPQDPMSDNIACVSSITEDHNGQLWVGTDGGGLFKLTKNGQTIRYTDQNSPLQNNSISTLTIDKHGTLWISTYLGGITTYDTKKGFKTYSNQRELKKVSCTLYDEKNDKLYFGTLGHGVHALKISENKLACFPSIKKNTWITSLGKDQMGTIWIGHTDGMACYDANTEQQKYIKLTESIDQSRIFSFLEDRDGSLWIGYFGGLIHYEKEKDAIAYLSQKEGLSSNMVFAIQQDSSGILWLSTGNGLSRLNPKSGDIKNFYAYDGLQDNEFHLGSAYKDKTGKMYFGGINGITVFNPWEVEETVHPISNIYFSQLRVLNKKVNYNEALGENNILDRHISQATHITLKKKQNVFALEFAVLEYSNPQKVVYAYKLTGFDKEWRYANYKNHSATYTNLPHGKYTFKVKAFFEGNTKDENIAYKQIDIRILPPWNKTWWAYSIYIALYFIIVWQILNIIKKRRLRAKERMEFEKKEMKLKMFTDISHEIRTPLTLVLNPLESMRESEKDPKQKNIYNLMYRNSLRILRLINQLMDMRKIDHHQLQMHFKPTDLMFFINDIMQSFEQIAIRRNIDFRLVTNRDLLEVWIDQGNFDKVLFNILSNAFKFTPDNGYMLISIDTFTNNKRSGLNSTIKEYVEINIENSGSFIDENKLERIFERFYQSTNNNHSGSGIGLHLAKMIVQLHHGTIQAKNIENGVALTVCIPLDNTHLSAIEITTEANTNDLYANIRADEKQPKQAEYIELPENNTEEPTIKANKLKNRIVFIDDDADLGKYLKIELSDLYNVAIFQDANEAWKIISTTIPDAVITDLIMPEIDGISLCQRIRQNPETNHIPVIILTSETDEGTKRRCIENGADSYLTKPTSLDLLKITISQTIQTRETIRNKYRSNIKLDFDTVKISSPDNRLVAKVIETIRKNIENSEFSVDDLSREVGLSRVHLNRKLKENINISPSNLIKSIRLKQAAYLLIKEKVNISEVAYKVGFSTPSYFTNSFREYFGMVPTEFVVKYTDLEDKEVLNKLFGE